MQIDEVNGRVNFDRLVRADRSLSSDETITMPKPAAKAIAVNAKGVFASRTLMDINTSAKQSASRIKEALLS